MGRYRFLSSPGRAKGFDSAHTGFGHWWTERITAVALLPLTIWFAASIIAYSGSDYQAFISWLSSPVVAVLMVFLLIAVFWHMALGLQVVIEDYVHSSAKIWSLLIVRLVCFTMPVAGILAVLSIIFGV